MRLFCPTWTIQKSKLIFVYNKKPAFQRVYFKSAQSIADEPIPQFSPRSHPPFAMRAARTAGMVLLPIRDMPRLSDNALMVLAVPSMAQEPLWRTPWAFLLP